MTAFTDAMREALRLTRAGELREASRAIRQALRPSAAAAGTSEGVFARTRARDAPPALTSSEQAPLPRPPPGFDDGSEASAPPQPKEGRFVAGSFSGAGGARAYKLWVPSARTQACAPPLIVMLHGCTQDADDFARGTRMNEHGERHGCYVLYPIQDSAANTLRCWRWFDAAHQHRESGEPCNLAGMTKQIVRDHGIDPDRVYVAGLSAGAAMTMVLGNTHPDLFAAIAVHSGLPLDAARDMPTAFAAMAGRSTASIKPLGRPVPAIVFHGEADRTVQSSNGDRIVRQLEQRFESNGVALTRRTATGTTHTTTAFHTADGRLVIEQWLVKGGGHAWYGGDPGGSYTDPDGPDASARLVSFLLAHSRNI